MSTQRNYTPETGMLPVWGFSDKIRKARDITGLSQKDFAARTNLTASTLAAYETGRSAPRFNDAPVLAKRLQLLTGIPADWFLVVDDPNDPNRRTLVPKVAGSTPVGGTLIPFPTRAGAALDRERLAPVTTLSQKRGA